MKKNLLWGSILFFSLLMVGAANAGKSSIEHGEKLFNDPTLGGSTNDTSCASCHPNGKDMEKAGENPKLIKMINSCIIGPLKGSKIDGRTVDMRSLKMYIRSLGTK